ncbi:Gliding motility lipoprotein gldH precursor [Weeksella virosa]|uniref:gliding motility lipoprotein GldH n=1 Tax=Weeksella virosa TaxID=1014 RepID=UPI000E07783F|nr:gliding motility lipoprotein GldH [Weeksella virosa]SUP53899.1 Gliding motility lipoprotein gldH precursor [Weeksella virosa]VEH64778.1 Gliding motility lipoprotein gldH precursor [Weeksella virosa]
MGHKTVKKISFTFLLVLIFFSCESKHYYQENQDLSAGWAKDSIKEFSFHVKDSVDIHANLAFLLRNKTDYAYSNLYLFTTIKDPKGHEMTDTLQYYIANPDGSWIGKGIQAKEQLLILRENLPLKDTGVYKIQVKQGMRTNILKGLKDISLIVDKTNN